MRVYLPPSTGTEKIFYELFFLFRCTFIAIPVHVWNNESVPLHSTCTRRAAVAFRGQARNGAVIFLRT